MLDMQKLRLDPISSGDVLWGELGEVISTVCGVESLVICEVNVLTVYGASNLCKPTFAQSNSIASSSIVFVVVLFVNGWLLV